MVLVYLYTDSTLSLTVACRVNTLKPPPPKKKWYSGISPLAIVSTKNYNLNSAIITITETVSAINSLFGKGRTIALSGLPNYVARKFFRCLDWRFSVPPDLIRFVHNDKTIISVRRAFKIDLTCKRCGRRASLSYTRV